jgi:tRNA modification GTPase
LPGEFTERAFLAGKLDLTQAEAIADLVAARTTQSRRAALRQLSGGLRTEAEQTATALQTALAHIEAAIDFPDDVGELDVRAVRTALDEATRRLDALLSGARYGRALTEGVTMALIGRPNVGKSSLLNALAGAERAIVTEFAGTTRDIVAEDLTVGGIPVRALDTAGLRETDDPVEAIGVERAKRAAQSADIVLIVADATEGVGRDERTLREAYSGRALLLANKCDLAPAPEGTIGISARTGAGLDRLGTAISEILGATASATLPLVTRVRHEDALRRALTAVEAARTSLETGQPPELIAVDCHGALQALGELTGETGRSEIIEGIFRTFCIGK